ncbi:MAG: MotA/TolQ/ExbB proton channel family protein [Coriobacteriales bacterium]|jgi:biopolymer transport protein ExbB/TolQ
MMEDFSLSGVMNAITQGLLVPTIVVLLLLVVYAVYTLGSLVVEMRTERARYKVALPRLIASLNDAEYDEIDGIIDRSGLLDSQRSALHELKSYMYLPEDALYEVARRLLADESNRYRKALSWTDAAVKIAPMLGLMGTLIPLGPGIMGLSSGDLNTLSSSLLTAFNTTVMGLVVAVVCYLVTRVRRRWYDDYLVSIEGAMNTLLEKAQIMRGSEEGRAELERAAQAFDSSETEASEDDGDAKNDTGEALEGDDLEGDDTGESSVSDGNSTEDSEEPPYVDVDSTDDSGAVDSDTDVAGTQDAPDEPVEDSNLDVSDSEGGNADA